MVRAAGTSWGSTCSGSVRLLERRSNGSSPCTGERVAVVCHGGVINARERRHRVGRAGLLRAHLHRDHPGPRLPDRSPHARQPQRDRPPPRRRGLRAVVGRPVERCLVEGPLREPRSHPRGAPTAPGCPTSPAACPTAGGRRSGAGARAAPRETWSVGAVEGDHAPTRRVRRRGRPSSPSPAGALAGVYERHLPQLRPSRRPPRGRRRGRRTPSSSTTSSTVAERARRWWPRFRAIATTTAMGADPDEHQRGPNADQCSPSAEAPRAASARRPISSAGPAGDTMVGSVALLVASVCAA